MKKEDVKTIIDVNHDEAKSYFLKNSSYFNGAFPEYINFEPMLEAVAKVLTNNPLPIPQIRKSAKSKYVNYKLTANKDGRFSWRLLELIHPAIYVTLVDKICEPDNWAEITKKLKSFKNGVVECCSLPIMPNGEETPQAAQVRNWWWNVEQQSIVCSLEYSHLIHTDVTDCYGSLYTHSIAWALHGEPEAKANRNKNELVGNEIDFLIRSSRHGQTNGISQGSVLMDFVAEMVLGWVDEKLTEEMKLEEWESKTDFKILRYRDDYRIFANSDTLAEEILKAVSDKLRLVGMSLGVVKTVISPNVVEGSIKSDKRASINLQMELQNLSKNDDELGKNDEETIQRKLLRLHSFGRQFSNSGALQRLLGNFHSEIVKQSDAPKDLEVPKDLEARVAILTDLGVTSPRAFPIVAGILSYMISLVADADEKKELWRKVKSKVRKLPHNGYLEIWLQRVTMPKIPELNLNSKEKICQVVNGNTANDTVKLWESEWIKCDDLKKALDVSKIVVGDPKEFPEVIDPKETELFASAIIPSWQVI